MLAVFIALASTLVESGFGTALIQNRSVTDIDYSTVFFFNIFTAISVYALLYWAAPLISRFYDQPELISLSRFMSMNIVITSLSLVHNTDPARKRSSSKQSRRSSLIFCFVIRDHWVSPWHIMDSACGVLLSRPQSTRFHDATPSLYFATIRGVPKLVFSMASFRRLLNFGSKLLDRAY